VRGADELDVGVADHDDGGKPVPVVALPARPTRRQREHEHLGEVGEGYTDNSTTTRQLDY